MILGVLTCCRDSDGVTLARIAINLHFAHQFGDTRPDYLVGILFQTAQAHPANAPAKDFWSVVVYDPQTRSQLQTAQPFPSKNNKRDALVANADGSVDLYFGPTAPAGKEANWIQTVPGKAWYTLFRLYGPLEPWFDKSWQLGEIEQTD